mmetsp:Transcript_11319/g.27845  ORF Transcript_11319/g.27845 Transcript_11319/m.27845 type:complete len:230 (+) Transcript_11319:1404-2093(+)
MIDAAHRRLASFGSKANDPQSSCCNFLRQLIHGNVGGSSHKDLAHVLPGEVIHQRRGCYGLASPRRSLDQTHRTLKHGRDRLDLTFIQGRQAGSGEIVRVGELWVGDELLFHGVAQQFVIDVARDARIVDGKIFESILHAIERRGFPDVLDDEVVGDLIRNLRPRIGILPAAAAVLFAVPPLALSPAPAGGDGGTQFEFHLAVDNVLDVAHPLPRRSVQVLRPRPELQT